MSLPTNLFDALAQAAQRFGDAEFLVVGRRRETAGFRALHRRAERFGHALTAHGIRPGDRVAVWMTNQLDWAVAAYGVARCGAVLVGVNTRLSPREVAHILTLSRPAAWILEADFLGKTRAVDAVAPILATLAERGVPAPAIILRGDPGEAPPGMLDFRAFEARMDLHPLPPAAELVAQSGRGEFAELDGVAAILSTSGTTAAPKGVMLGHARLIRLAAACAERQALAPGEKFYSVGPFFHCSGYMHALLANLLSGSTVFTTSGYRAEEAWEVISGEGITLYHGSIVPLQEITALPGFDRGRIPRFDRAWYSAPAVEMARLEALMGTRQCEVYGLTETGGNVAICRASDPVAMRHDSDGRPHDGIEVAIVDPETNRNLPDGTPGEIRVRGWNLMHGYFRDAEATAKAIDEDGWLHTGDQGVLLPGGYLKFLSRLKDVIRVGGENLSPLEVEEVLMAHPAVHEAAVVAAPHPRLTEVPVAFVVAEPGPRPDPEEIRAFCRTQLANFKVPARVILLDDMPRSQAVLRVSKARLREMLDTL
ncbi:MAG: class I adenylate-forming enzyme family protein [Nevskiales bacterium]